MELAKEKVTVLEEMSQQPENKDELTSKVQQYLSRWTPGSPLTAEMIVNASIEHKMPAGFILAVCHNESHCGTKGRAVPTRNPFNVGNVTAGDDKPTSCALYSNCLASFEVGLNIFISQIKRCYFHENEEIRLETWMQRDFKAVRCNIAGMRYMTDPKSAAKFNERINNLNELQIKY